MTAPQGDRKARPSVPKAVVLIGLGGLAACIVLAIVTFRLNEAMHDDALRRAWQDLGALADVAYEEMQPAFHDGLPRPEALAERFSRVKRTLYRLEPMHLAMAGKQGLVAANTLDTGELPTLDERLLPALKNAGWPSEFEAHAPGGRYFVAFRPLPTASGSKAHLGIVAWVEHDLMLAEFHEQRRQLAISILGIAAMLVSMTVLLAAYVRNKLAFNAELQLREARLAASEALLLEAEKLAEIGSWEIGETPQSFVATRGYYAIYQVDAKTAPVSDEAYISRFLVEPEDIRRAREQVALIATGAPAHGLRHVRLDDGTRKWLEFHVIPLADASGRRVGARGVVRDVTEARNAHAALEARTTQLQQAKEIAGMGTWSMEVADGTLTICAQMRRILGTGIEDAPRTLREWALRFILLEEQPEFLALLDAHFHGKPFDREQRIVTGDGRQCWIRTIAEPEFDGRGNVCRYNGVTLDITFYKTAMRNLAEKTAQLERAQQLGRMGSWYWDVQTDRVDLSAQHRTIYGMDSETVVATMQEWVNRCAPPEESALALETLNRARSGQSLNVERRARNLAGQDMWIHAITEPVFDQDGKVIGVTGISRDITEEKLSQLALEEASRRLHEAQRIARLGYFYWDLKTDRIDPFGEFDAVFGIDAQRRFHTMREWELDYCHPDDRPTEDLRAEGAAQAYQVQRRTRLPDGHYRWVEISGEATLDSQGRIAGYRGVVRDIHEPKSMQLQLSESEQRFRLIAQNMQDIVSLHDLNGKVTFLSPSFHAVTGHQGSIASGSVRRMFHPDDRREAFGAFGRIARSSSGSTTVTARLRHADGRYLWFESHITHVAGPGAPKVQIVSRDVTRKREAEQQLARRTAELARINRQLAVEVRQRQELERNVLMTIEMELARVGLELHDQLGQDLTGISLMAKTLERRLAERAPDIAANALRISELVNNTIRHTRMISHGLSPYIWGSNGLAAALSQLASDIQALGVVDIHVRIDPEIGIRDELVARNLYRIAQEASNNALKHSHAARLTLELSRRGPAVTLKVTDDGIGGIEADTGAVAADSRFHSIRHRCSVIGAELSIRHPRRGGTEVKIQWHNPLAGTPEAIDAVAPTGRENA